MLRKTFSKAAGSGSQLYLGLPIASGTSSLVVLSVTADDLQLTTNRCPGSITAAQVSLKRQKPPFYRDIRFC